MKTPKRAKFSHMRCEFCKCVASVDDEDNKIGWFECPHCGNMSKFSDEGFVHVSLYARWIRKNREARLRHKISKLSQALKDAAKTDDFWRNYYKHYQNDRLLKRSIFIKECGTYGQDVEGS